MGDEGPGTGFLTGGCHCGAVRFRVRAPSDIVVHDCNCSMCSRVGYLHLIVGREDFELLSGGDELTEYRFNTGSVAGIRGPNSASERSSAVCNSAPGAGRSSKRSV